MLALRNQLKLVHFKLSFSCKKEILSLPEQRLWKLCPFGTFVNVCFKKNRHTAIWMCPICLRICTFRRYFLPFRHLFCIENDLLLYICKEKRWIFVFITKLMNENKL
jgi:hypothetical protein